MTQIVDGLDIASLISLWKICDDNGIAILDKNEINTHLNTQLEFQKLTVARQIINRARNTWQFSQT